MIMLRTFRITIFFIIYNTVIINDLYSKEYKINQKESSVTFSATHADNKFVGQINNYQAEIFFDQNNLANSKINIIFAMDSFKTGNNMYDKALPTMDWFNIKNYPESYFNSSKIIQKSDGNFQIFGDLTIKNITKKINFDFKLQDFKKNLVNVISNFTINRLDFKIGQESDFSGQWVDLQIKINLNLITKGE